MILVQAVHATRERINNTLEHVTARIKSLTNAVEAAYRLEWAREQPSDFELVVFLPAGVKKDELEDVKKILIIMRQHELCLRQATILQVICNFFGERGTYFLNSALKKTSFNYFRKLTAELEESNKKVQLLIERLQKTLLQLHEVVRYRAAVPTIQVYPLFIDLSGVWAELQDETACLSHVNTILVHLNSVNKV